MRVLLFTLVLLLSSCRWSEKQQGTEEIEAMLTKDWLYTLELETHFPDGQIISRPPGIYQLLARLVLPDEGGKNFKTQCLYYRVPYKNHLGTIRLQLQKDQSLCPEVPEEGGIVELTDLSDLKLSLINFRLVMDLKISGRPVKWGFLMPNLAMRPDHEKYEPQKDNGLYPGLSFVHVSEENFDVKNSFFLGKLSDRLSKGTAIRCLQIDKSCRQVGEDRCDQCRYGWYQVVDHNCQGKGSRFCGQNHCGEKNEPACVRGTKVVEDVDSGICQSDLTPVWNGDHILVCQ